jgi:hypothetical protein
MRALRTALGALAGGMAGMLAGWGILVLLAPSSSADAAFGKVVFAALFGAIGGSVIGFRWRR